MRCYNWQDQQCINMPYIYRVCLSTVGLASYKIYIKIDKKKFIVWSAFSFNLSMKKPLENVITLV